MIDMTKKYKKRPVVISAYQWLSNDTSPDVCRYNNRNGDSRIACNVCSVSLKEHGWIDTLEGGHIVCPNDWIITGVVGEQYACKPGIFEDTYEEVK